MWQDQESDASGGSNGGRSQGSGSSASKKRKRQHSNKGAGDADSRGAVIDIEGDEPAQLIALHPVSCLLVLSKCQNSSADILLIVRRD